MWTKQHRPCHEASPKRVVWRHAVEGVARWLERADPPQGEVATPASPMVSAIAR